MKELKISKSDSNYIILKYVSDKLVDNNLEFWLEGGTALSAYRDETIFDWEHDIDLAIWYEDLKKLLNSIDQFISDGCKVKIQKGFPFIDNVIQLFIPEEITGINPHINQVDFYIYRKCGDFGYMRWLNAPTGYFSQSIRVVYFWLKSNLLISDISKRYLIINYIIPKKMRYFIFKTFFYFYYRYGKCIYHVIPVKYFNELKKINLYNIFFNISKDTEGYLEYRYGKNWKTPDSEFNNNFYKEKWKTINARQEIKFSFLEKPELDFNLQKKFINNKK